jgi:hypothetical protein
MTATPLERFIDATKNGPIRLPFFRAGNLLYSFQKNFTGEDFPMNRIRFALFFVWCLGLPMMAALAQGTAEAPFKALAVEGEVLLVADGKDPVPVNSGDALPVGAGRLVTLETGAVKLAFPNGKEFQLMQNSMMFLAPGAQTLEDACAAVGAVREPTVVFLQPANGATLPAGKPVTLLFGANLNSPHFKGIAELSLKMIESGAKGSGKGVAKLTLPAQRPAAAEKPLFHTFRVTLNEDLAKAGDFDFFVETIDKPLGKPVKPELSLTFEPAE